MKRKSAFTLIELLITISIIAILAVLAGGAFGVVRTKAEAAKCVSNLKATNSALVAFITDYNGNLLPSSAWSTYASVNISQYKGIRDYLGIETDVLNVNDAANISKFRYATVLTCPSMRRLNPNNTALYRCYSANTWLYIKDPGSAYRNLPLSQVPNQRHAPLKMVNVREPSKMWTFADASGLNNDTEYAGSFGSVANEPFLLYPHQNRNHFVFFDGHVEALSKEEFLERAKTKEFWGRLD